MGGDDPAGDVAPGGLVAVAHRLATDVVRGVAVEIAAHAAEDSASRLKDADGELRPGKSDLEPRVRALHDKMPAVARNAQAVGRCGGHLDAAAVDLGLAVLEAHHVRALAHGNAAVPAHMAVAALVR